jgi:hypothetical protein
MRLREVVERLNLDILALGDQEREVRWAYTSDLLSDVMAGAQPGDLWLTIQRHMNIVAVAKLRDLAGIVLAKGHRPAQEVVDKAKEEGIALMVSEDPLFELCGEMYQILKGRG